MSFLYTDIKNVISLSNSLFNGSFIFPFYFVFIKLALLMSSNKVCLNLLKISIA